MNTIVLTESAVTEDTLPAKVSAKGCEWVVSGGVLIDPMPNTMALVTVCTDLALMRGTDLLGRLQVMLTYGILRINAELAPAERQALVLGAHLMAALTLDRKIKYGQQVPVLPLPTPDEAEQIWQDAVTKQPSQQDQAPDPELVDPPGWGIKGGQA